MQGNALEYSNASRSIFIGPSTVYSVTISGDGANGDCDLYDGESTSDTQKLHLEVLSGTSFQHRSGEGVLYRRGIYLHVNASTTKVSVEFKPVSPRDFPLDPVPGPAPSASSGR